MAKIVLSIADTDLQTKISDALREKSHAVETAAVQSPMDNPKKTALALCESKADAVIADYIADDSFSVKVLQDATEQDKAPRFIFILPEGDVSVSHILMAVNEGASAILRHQVKMDTLLNYVDRALSGPSRFRHDRDSIRMEAIAKIEIEQKKLQTKLASCRKLISYLMSTALNLQTRSALIVSSSAYQRDYLRKVLDEHGFSALEASTPDEAIPLALEHKPRIVISDLETEGKNGIEFCKALKIENKYMPCHFVIVTSSADKVEKVMTPGNGVDGCVIKPSDDTGNQELMANVGVGLLL